MRVPVLSSLGLIQIFQLDLTVNYRKSVISPSQNNIFLSFQLRLFSVVRYKIYSFLLVALGNRQSQLSLLQVMTAGQQQLSDPVYAERPIEQVSTIIKIRRETYGLPWCTIFIKKIKTIYVSKQSQAC